jgi:cellulose synthase operon protein C
VLEPQEKHDPYNEWMKHGDELKKQLAELPKIKDPAELAKRIRELYRTGGGGRSVAECRFLVLHEGMPFAARVSEEFTVELLGCVPETMAAAGTGIAELGKKQGQLLERSLFLAAHFDRRDLLQQLVEQFVSVLQSKPDDDRFDVVNFVASQCLRSLRKLGLQDEIDRLLKRLVEVVLGKQSLQQFRVKYASSPAHWGKALQSLLHIAGGWMTFGLTSQAVPILDEARNELLGSGAAKLTALDFTKLCVAYISAVGHGPVENGLPRLAELLAGLDPNRVTNTFTTAQFYSRLHLNVVEEMVLALASDEFALGATGRRWLEDDEKLVRDRIHADMRKHLSAGGL